MYLVDSSIWVSLFLNFDVNHEHAKKIIAALTGGIYVSYGVVSETATVLAYKHSKKQADNFIEYLVNNEDIILIDRRVSFTDISLLYLSKKFGLTVITLDKELGKLIR